MPAQTLVAGALARLGRAALTFARSIAVRLGLKPEAVRSRALAAGLLTVGTALSVSLLAALGPALASDTVPCSAAGTACNGRRFQCWTTRIHAALSRRRT